MNKSILFLRVLFSLTKLSTLIFCLLLSSTLIAQDQHSNSSGASKEFTLTRKLTDVNNEDLQGATIKNIRTNKSVISKENGSLIITANETIACVFS